jgi:hypothetical protein
MRGGRDEFYQGVALIVAMRQSAATVEFAGEIPRMGKTPGSDAIARCDDMLEVVFGWIAGRASSAKA